jgi:succinate dehydrogenase / fumarate reductase, cytochrome b subunit
MTRALRFYRTSIGKKVVMAITGLILFGYVAIHMLGNLQVFMGPEHLNNYAATLKSNLALLWTARLVLLTAGIWHIVAALQVTRMSQRSRPEGYYYKDVMVANYASRTMRWTGPILAVFVIYHVLHFTTGTVHPHFDHADVYANVVTGFRVWAVAAFYIVAMVALGLHLWHGAWSMFQSVGLNSPRADRFLHRFAAIAMVVIVMGFISIPVAILARLIS